MRPLNDNESKLLLKVLGATKGGEALAEQVPHVRVVDQSIPTLLRLLVDDGVPVATMHDGPIPGRFPVYRQGQSLGEILVWVDGGRLSAIEYAWVTESGPTRIPDVDEVGTSEAWTGSGDGL